MNQLLISFLYVFLIVSCSGKDNQDAKGGDVAFGEQVYKKYCVLCHGSDGKMGMNGSKDLTVSILSLEERKVLIRDGKNLMTPFKGVLTVEEISAVAAYTMTMKAGQ